MRRAIPTISIAILACSPSPQADRLAAQFERDPSVFERLKQMVSEDIGSRNCFAVGLDHIGDYWEHSGSWNHQRDFERKMNLSEVLNEEGLSEPRFDEYRVAFSLSDSERIDYCNRDGSGPIARVLVYRSGLSVSGCIGFISWEAIVPDPKKWDQDFEEIKPLRDGWYVDYSCT